MAKQIKVEFTLTPSQLKVAAKKAGVSAKDLLAEIQSWTTSAAVDQWLDERADDAAEDMALRYWGEGSAEGKASSS